MFDWMNRKVRVNPIKQLGLPAIGLGQGEEFRTLRTCDNAFYWLTTDAIHERHQAVFADLGKKNPPVTPATLYAKISIPENIAIKKGGAINKADIFNHINVQTRGVGQATVWLGPNMLNYDLPVQVRLNGSFQKRMPLLQPSLKVLIQDFCQRGDRQRLYFAKIDLRP
jgi:hypothetical protein